MTTRVLLATIALLLGLAKLASGQDSSLQIRALLIQPSKPDVNFYFGKPGESITQLNLVEEVLTDPQTAPTENGSLNLFTSATVDKNNPLASLAATVKVPAGISRVIIIIVPAAQGLPPYRMVILDDDPKSFPWGESRVVNMTPMDFALEVGDQKVLLPGGKITPVPKVTKLDEYNRAQTNFYFRESNRWVVAAERQMQYVDALRRVFLIFKSPGALAPDVRTVIDRPPPVLE